MLLWKMPAGLLLHVADDSLLSHAAMDLLLLLLRMMLAGFLLYATAKLLLLHVAIDLLLLLLLLMVVLLLPVIPLVLLSITFLSHESIAFVLLHYAAELV